MQAHACTMTRRTPRGCTLTKPGHNSSAAALRATQHNGTKAGGKKKGPFFKMLRAGGGGRNKCAALETQVREEGAGVRRAMQNAWLIG